MKHVIIERVSLAVPRRLTDMSKTVRAKQIQVIGRLNAEDITPQLRRLEKQHKIDFTEMPPRIWFYNGSTFKSPEFKQKLKPYKINNEIKQEWINSLPKPKTPTLKDRIQVWFSLFMPIMPKTKSRVSNSFFESENLEETIEELDNQEKENEEEDLNAISEEWIK